VWRFKRACDIWDVPIEISLFTNRGYLWKKYLPFICLTTIWQTKKFLKSSKSHESVWFWIIWRSSSRIEVWILKWLSVPSLFLSKVVMLMKVARSLKPPPSCLVEMFALATASCMSFTHLSLSLIWPSTETEDTRCPLLLTLSAQSKGVAEHGIYIYSPKKNKA